MTSYHRHGYSSSCRPHSVAGVWAAAVPRLLDSRPKHTHTHTNDWHPLVPTLAYLRLLFIHCRVLNHRHTLCVNLHYKKSSAVAHCSMATYIHYKSLNKVIFSLIIAALVVSFRKRSFFSFLTSPSSKEHTFRFCAYSIGVDQVPWTRDTFNSRICGIIAHT